MKKIIEDEVDSEKFVTTVESLSSNDSPIIITQSEFIRRMKEQQELSAGGMQMFGSIPEKYDLVINSNHEIVSKILSEKNKKKKTSMVKQLLDLALLSKDMLKGEDLTNLFKKFEYD